MRKTPTLYDILKDRLKGTTADTLFLNPPHNGKIESQGTLPVVIRLDTPSEQVKATKWFDDIWLYLRINLREDKEKGVKNIPFVSICFFQEMYDNTLNILFRAEWDNYPLVEGYNHPQPHWHISHVNNKKTDNYYSLNNSSEEDDAGDFSEMMNDEKQTLNVYKMHFAMSGNWIDNGNVTTEYVNNQQIADWIVNLLRHVKNEITYAKD